MSRNKLINDWRLVASSSAPEPRRPRDHKYVRISCREIAAADLLPTAHLLARGFPRHSAAFWREALARLSARQTPPGLPRYGFLLESNDDTLVGVVLTLFREVNATPKKTIQCNLSSWYVEPEFRCYAPLLQPRGPAYRNVTFVNITPARHTLPLLEAQGFVQYSSGLFIAVPTVRRPWNVYVEPFSAATCTGSDLEASMVNLLREHTRYNCISVTCRDSGVLYPFVFKKWHSIRGIPTAYLVYCQNIESFVRFAGPLGRFLTLQGFPLVILDAVGPRTDLVGKFIDGQPKLFKGPNMPSLGDLAFTERALFGF
jgi:hypothetical protein